MSVERIEVWKINERVIVFFQIEKQVIGLFFLEDCSYLVYSIKYFLYVRFRVRFYEIDIYQRWISF